VPSAVLVGTGSAPGGRGYPEARERPVVAAAGRPSAWRGPAADPASASAARSKTSPLRPARPWPVPGGLSLARLWPLAGPPPASPRPAPASIGGPVCEEAPARAPS